MNVSNTTDETNNNDEIVARVSASFDDEEEGVQPVLGITPWIPIRVNRYPSDYPEQKICLEDLITVAVRISDCNRIRSNEAEYDNDTATAKCMAPQNTRFRIKLFHGETERHIIVDMRKISGCGLVYQEEYRAIMNAAKFGEIAQRKPSEYVKPLVLDEPGMDNNYIPLKDSVLKQSPLSVKSHFHSDCHEDVASTTNSEHSSIDTALNASKIIMEETSGIQGENAYRFY